MYRGHSSYTKLSPGEGNGLAVLFTISILVELIALLTAIWLGVYLVTRSPRKAEAWLTALASWSLGGLFINMLFALIPPGVPSQFDPWLNLFLIFWPRGILEQDPAAWLQGWTATPAAVFWFHATLLMRPGKLTARRKTALIAGYLLAAGGIAIQALLPERYNSISGDPLYLNAIQGGWLYGLYLGMMLLFCALSVRNLMLVAQGESQNHKQRRLRLLIAVTALAGLTGPVGLVAAFVDIPVPMFLVALLIAAGLILMVYDVARYNALMESHVFLRDFSFSALLVGAAVNLSLLVVWGFDRIYEPPPFTYVLIGVVTVVAYSLVEAARQSFDLRVLQQENRLQRERLRGIAQLSGEDDLLKNLSRSLDIICEPLQATYAILLKEDDGYYRQVAAYHWAQEEAALPRNTLESDDYLLLKPGRLPPPLEDAALLIPLYFGSRQVGALVLGEAEHGANYSPIEMENLLDCNDYLAGRLEQLNLQERAQDLISDTLPGAAECQDGVSSVISTATVEMALRKMHDYAQLSDSSLAELRLVRQRLAANPTHLETGEAVHALLCEALEKLHPRGEVEPPRIGKIPRRDWYPYHILRQAYIDLVSNREVMAQLYISEGTFNRTRRSAVRSLVRLLQEMERSAAR